MTLQAFDPSFAAAPSPSAPRRCRSLWAFDEREEIVRLAGTPAGRLVLVSLFAVAAWLASIHPMAVAVAAGFAHLPRYRSWIALGAALSALIMNPDGRISIDGIGAILLQEGLDARSASAWGITAAAVVTACAGWLFVLIRRDKARLVARRPALSLLGALLALCAMASLPWPAAPVRAAWWSVVVVFAAFFWFIAYALVDQRSRTPAALPFQLGILNPFWGSSATPFGKGAAFLRKHQAKDDVELAVTQLKGLKLLLWALFLALAAALLDEALTDRLGIPRPDDLYGAFARGEPFQLHLAWAGLAWATLGGTLTLAIWGHEIIAIARLAGFRLPRNTWRPLRSRSLAEFWNRYYYYFKELMVEFFFMPTFLRSFRQHPRLRVFFATFMAAGVGNAIYHFIRDIEYVALLGPVQAFEDFASYFLYCFLLAIGIGISQARISAGRQLPVSLLGMLWSGLCVWGFFICLHVFSDESRTLSLRERLSFFVTLFGYG